MVWRTFSQLVVGGSEIERGGFTPLNQTNKQAEKLEMEGATNT